jgi:hypothetical protein
MNNQSKAYAILLYLIWPFSAVLLGLKYFDFKFGKNLLIASFAFLGFTAISFGDLERYEFGFYSLARIKFLTIFSDLFSLQTGKFYNDIFSLITTLFFTSHHFYFMLLFLVYGYLLINIIDSFKELNIKKHDRFGLLFFVGFALYFSISNILNLAFYTGALFIIYCLIKYYNKQDKKYLFLILLAPLFHLGLIIFIFLPLFVILFKNKIRYYLIFLVFTFGIGQSNFVAVIENLASNNSGTIIETKYKAYASEKGQESLDKRYEERAKTENFKLKSLFFLKNTIWYVLTPLGLFLLFLNRRALLYKYDLVRLFNLVLLCLGVSNLMLNISQGDRFLNIYCFLAIGLFYKVYTKTKSKITNKWLNIYLKILMPIVLVTGLMSLVASHFMIPLKFYASNFLFEIYYALF